jgi:hypothetical protein
MGRWPLLIYGNLFEPLGRFGFDPAGCRIDGGATVLRIEEFRPAMEEGLRWGTSNAAQHCLP